MRKSRIQSQSEEFRPRSVSLKARLMGTIVLNNELKSMTIVNGRASTTSQVLKGTNQLL